MSGLLRRLTRRRAAPADEAHEGSEPAATPADTAAAAGADRPLPSDGEHATRLLPATGEQPASGDAPAGAAWAGTPAPGDERPTGETRVEAPGPAAIGEEQPTGAGATWAGHPRPERSEPDTTASGSTAAGAIPATGDAAASRGATAATAADAEARPAPGRDLPAGVDPAELEVAPAPSARRGRLRRRLRYLRRVRDLLLRDLGGFTYEVHRTAGGTAREAHRRLIEAKAGRLTALDAEVRELEGRLGTAHAETIIREPGIGGTCPSCGEFHSSDARYCWRCGTPLDAQARAERDAAIAAAAPPATGSHETAEPQAASVLWAAGPRPRNQPTGADLARVDAPAPADQPTAATPPPEPRPAAPPASEEPAAAPEPANASGDDAAAASGDEPADAGEPPAFTPEDEAPPVTSGDPLTTRREPGS